MRVFGLQVSGSGSQASGSRFQVPGFALRVWGYGLGWDLVRVWGSGASLSPHRPHSLSLPLFLFLSLPLLLCLSLSPSLPLFSPSLSEGVRADRADDGAVEERELVACVRAHLFRV